MTLSFPPSQLHEGRRRLWGRAGRLTRPRLPCVGGQRFGEPTFFSTISDEQRRKCACALLMEIRVKGPRGSRIYYWRCPNDRNCCRQANMKTSWLRDWVSEHGNGTKIAARMLGAGKQDSAADTKARKRTKAAARPSRHGKAAVRRALQQTKRPTLVKTLVWIGPNDHTLSGWSSKLYILTVRGRRFTYEWGAVEHDSGGLRPVWLRGKQFTFGSHRSAVRALNERLAAKRGPRTYGHGYRIWRGSVFPVRGKHGIDVTRAY